MTLARMLCTPMIGSDTNMPAAKALRSCGLVRLLDKCCSRISLSWKQYAESGTRLRRQ